MILLNRRCPEDPPPSEGNLYEKKVFLEQAV